MRPITVILAIVLILSSAACPGDGAPPPVDAAEDSGSGFDGLSEPDAPADATDVSELELFRTDLSLVPPAGTVVAGVTAKSVDLVGGPKAEAQVGDLKLANHLAAFMVETARPVGGYRSRGGYVVDLDLQPGGEDLFAEIWFAWNFRVFSPTEAEVISDGTDGAAVVQVRGRLETYPWIDSFLGGLFGSGDTDLAVAMTYTLRPDSPTLDLVVSLENDTGAAVDLDWPLLAVNQGDGVPVFNRVTGFDNVEAGPLPALMAVGLKRAYGFIAGDVIPPEALIQVSSILVSVLPARSIAAGETAEFRFTYVVGDDGTNTVEALRADRFGGDATAVIRGAVNGETGWDPGEFQPSHTHGITRVVATNAEGVVAVAPVRADGTFELHVPPGAVEVTAYAPQRGASEPVTVEAGADTGALELALPDLGRVVVQVRDLDGAVIPGQVQFFREAGTPNPYGPANSRYEPDWGRGRSAVLFATEEDASVHLLPGDYRVVASRGYNWEKDVRTVTVAPGLTETLTFTLEKTVDDAGWTAADLHLHAFWSPDADVPYPTRLRQAAANDLTLPVFTEHTYMGDLAPARAEAGVDAWVTPVHGQEVTTFEYGHFNAYPLELDMLAPSFGAVFEHGRAGTELFDAMRVQHDGDEIVQINHPRSSSSFQAYFTSVGLPTDFGDATGVAPASPEHWTEDWDVLEVFNGRCGGGENLQVLADWFALYDRGLRKALGSGSDSHSEASGLGHPRSWIAVEKAAVDADPEALVAPLRARQSFVSCGPFVRFSTEDGVGMGGLAGLDMSGDVRFSVRVEAPSWMQVDTVRLLERGVVVQTIDVDAWNASERPEGLRAGVRFEGSFTVTPTHDTWFVIEVLGAGGLEDFEPGDTPYAMTNPIDVDADGDGSWSAPGAAGLALPAGDKRLDDAPAKRVVHHEAGHGHTHGHGPELTPEAFQAALRAFSARRGF